jgi:S-DNA-T family DNA segregation ATPase FtsK/SpoIIIE
MELALGRALLTRFAPDAERSVILLEDAVAAMQQRANDLAGKTGNTPRTSRARRSWC